MGVRKEDEANSSDCGQPNTGLGKDEVGVADHVGPCKSLNFILLQHKNIRAFEAVNIICFIL